MRTAYADVDAFSPSHTHFVSDPAVAMWTRGAPVTVMRWVPVPEAEVVVGGMLKSEMPCIHAKQPMWAFVSSVRLFLLIFHLILFT